MEWKTGAKLMRDNSPEMGVGVVVGLEGRFIDVYFPLVDQEIKLTPEAAGIRAINLRIGDAVTKGDNDPSVIVSLTAGLAGLEDGTSARVEELWPLIVPETLLDRLSAGKLDELDAIINRLDGYRLLEMRKSGLIASLIGGRVELFPHQLDTAAKAIQEKQVRWLLADEVGLGKTIVASMIIAALVRMGRVSHALIVAPDTLTVQWLGELYRKFHQVFVHVDEERIDCVKRDFGPEVNPFDIHPLAIVSFEMLADYPGVFHSLQAAPLQLVVVDEAHQAIDSKLEALVLPLVESTEHALFLTATPFQSGRKGFLRLVDALHVDHEIDDAGVHHVHHVSAVTRNDIHDLGTRVPMPTQIEGDTESLDANNPRVAWILSKIAEWRTKGERVLIFVNNAQRATELSATLTYETQTRIFMFHEEMRAAERDIELAQFRISKSPLLISSGAGSEGRNFQFCDIQVHVELPDDPVVLEQRIGRVDRIGRDTDIPIVYFHGEGRQGELAKVYEQVRIFEDASIGSSPAMAHLRQGLKEGFSTPEELDAMLVEVEQQVLDEAGKWVFSESHSQADSSRIESAIPPDLDYLIEKFCYNAAERIGLDVVEKDGESVYFFEYGNAVEVDAIPGLEHGQRFMGTFRRDEAVENGLLDFFSNGHALVESLLIELEDNKRGRVGALRLAPEKSPGLRGLYVFYFESTAGAPTPKLLPIAHAGSTANWSAVARRLPSLLEEHATSIGSAQTRALMKKVGAHPRLARIDASRLEMLLLIAVMD